MIINMLLICVSFLEQQTENKRENKKKKKRIAAFFKRTWRSVKRATICGYQENPMDTLRSQPDQVLDVPSTKPCDVLSAISPSCFVDA